MREVEQEIIGILMAIRDGVDVKNNWSRLINLWYFRGSA
jgi:hypothetical protein